MRAAFGAQSGTARALLRPQIQFSEALSPEEMLQRNGDDAPVLEVIGLGLESQRMPRPHGGQFRHFARTRKPNSEAIGRAVLRALDRLRPMPSSSRSESISFGAYIAPRPASYATVSTKQPIIGSHDVMLSRGSGLRIRHTRAASLTLKAMRDGSRRRRPLVALRRR